MSTTLAQPWAGKIDSAEAERAALQADLLGGPRHDEMISLRDRLVPAAIPRATRRASPSRNSAAADEGVAGDVALAPQPQRGSRDYQPEAVSSTGYRRTTGGNFVVDRPGQIEKSTATAPRAGNLQHPKQHAWLASTSEASTVEPRDVERADRLWRDERARRRQLETRPREIQPRWNEFSNAQILDNN